MKLWYKGLLAAVTGLLLFMVYELQSSEVAGGVVLNEICSNNFTLARDEPGQYSDYIEQVSKEVIYYKANSEYGYVKPVYFKTLIQLCEQIEKTPEVEKWLIFVSSKKKGEDIKNYLQTKNIDSVMITAETKYHKKGLGGLVPKEYEVYNSIINECKSIVRVTLATAVLDNGVNLKD